MNFFRRLPLKDFQPLEVDPALLRQVWGQAKFCLNIFEDLSLDAFYNNLDRLSSQGQVRRNPEKDESVLENPYHPFSQI